MKGKTMEGVTNNEPVLSEEQLVDIAGGGAFFSSPSRLGAVDNPVAKKPAAVAAAAKFYAVRGERLATEGNPREANRFVDAANKILDKNEKAAGYLFK
jgi:hypothetical protein